MGWFTDKYVTHEAHGRGRHESLDDTHSKPIGTVSAHTRELENEGGFKVWVIELANPSAWFDVMQTHNLRRARTRGRGAAQKSIDLESSTDLFHWHC